MEETTCYKDCFLLSVQHYLRICTLFCYYVYIALKDLCAWTRLQVVHLFSINCGELRVKVQSGHFVVWVLLSISAAHHQVSIRPLTDKHTTSL